ncbi:MAG TPA: hypothetical protein VK778_01465, partial [Solirubrobacteraceae bacterium]|nr:hypothetical protein [Solirubrobacteraceae bacterium]
WGLLGRLGWSAEKDTGEVIELGIAEHGVALHAAVETMIPLLAEWLDDLDPPIRANPTAPTSYAYYAYYANSPREHDERSRASRRPRESPTVRPGAEHGLSPIDRADLDAVPNEVAPP